MEKSIFTVLICLVFALQDSVIQALPELPIHSSFQRTESFVKRARLLDNIACALCAALPIALHITASSKNVQARKVGSVGLYVLRAWPVLNDLIYGDRMPQLNRILLTGFAHRLQKMNAAPFLLTVYDAAIAYDLYPVVYGALSDAFGVQIDQHGLK